MYTMIQCTSCGPDPAPTPAQPGQAQPPGTQGPQPPSAGPTPPTTSVVVPTYIGESGRNMMTRSLEHLQLLGRKHKSSALWKHCEHAHGGDVTTPFSMKLISKHRDPLGRVIAEGVLINHLDPAATLNSRAEHKQPKVARVLLARALPATQAQLGGDEEGPQGHRQGTQTAGPPPPAAGPTAPPRGPRTCDKPWAKHPPPPQHKETQDQAAAPPPPQ